MLLNTVTSGYQISVYRGIKYGIQASMQCLVMKIANSNECFSALFHLFKLLNGKYYSFTVVKLTWRNHITVTLLGQKSFVWVHQSEIFGILGLTLYCYVHNAITSQDPYVKIK